MNHSYVDGCGGKGAVCLELGFHTAPRDYAAPSGACPVESALVQGGAKSRLNLGPPLVTYPPRCDT